MDYVEALQRIAKEDRRGYFGGIAREALNKVQGSCDHSWNSINKDRCIKCGLRNVFYEKDGDSFTAKRSDFINLQESYCGFGKTEDEAMRDLITQELGIE